MFDVLRGRVGSDAKGHSRNGGGTYVELHLEKREGGDNEQVLVVIEYKNLDYDRQVLAKE